MAFKSRRGMIIEAVQMSFRLASFESISSNPYPKHLRSGLTEGHKMRANKPITLIELVNLFTFFFYESYQSD